MRLNQRPVPEPALRDENAVEMLRVWIAEEGIHCSMKIGMYQEMKISENKAWSTILADVAQHVANALSQFEDVRRDKIVYEIREQFIQELNNPTSKARGRFDRKN